MQILEREDQLAQLTACFERSLRGQGTCTLISGEAGAGKTTLIQRFAAALPADIPQLVAGCEALFSPRPLGPLIDLSDELPPALSHAMREGHIYNSLYPEFLAYLRKAPTPKLVAIEDLQWADASTLDLVRYVGRRLGNTPLLFMLSYRDDDLGPDHPLRRLLGELPAISTVRVPVPSLSRQAVGKLAAGASRAATGLFEATAGNPFYVTEVLSAQEGAIPASVYDAVMSRLSRVSAPARSVAELVSISPKHIERTLAEGLVDNAGAALDECVEKGVLRAVGRWLAFRHELARQAVEQSLPPGRATALHRRVFAALRDDASDPAALSRLVHHAELGGLGQEVLALAPAAARAAAQVSSHREAAALYTLALAHAAALDPAARAGLLEAAATEYHLTSAVQECLAATREALALRRQTGDRPREGMNLRVLATTIWRERGDRQEAEAAIREAIAVLESTSASPELARAYAELSRLHSAWSEYAQSIRVGEEAYTLAESLGDPVCLVEALHAFAAARMFVSNDPSARAQLERALALALDQHLEEAAARLYASLQMVCMIYRDHPHALDICNRGIAFCEARDLDAYVFRLVDNRAFSLIELGRWDEAARDIDRCLAASAIGERLRDSVLFLQARQAARRGEPWADDYWRRMQDAPGDVRIGYRLPAIAAACAEAAWLRGDAAAAERVARIGLPDAIAHGNARLLGPLLVWLERLGAGVPVHDQAIAAPHGCELSGDVAAAAEAWAKLSCPYERALALLHGDESQIREALKTLDALGAKPAARIARMRLRQSGARGVQRGPQPRTRTDPLGLTVREREVYELLLQSLTSAQIAARLHRSERTIEHHVAAIFSKRGVGSRAELLAQRSA